MTDDRPGTGQQQRKKHATTFDFGREERREGGLKKKLYRPLAWWCHDPSSRKKERKRKKELYTFTKLNILQPWTKIIRRWLRWSPSGGAWTGGSGDGGDWISPASAILFSPIERRHQIIGRSWFQIVTQQQQLGQKKKKKPKNFDGSRWMAGCVMGRRPSGPKQQTDGHIARRKSYHIRQSVDANTLDMPAWSSPGRDVTVRMKSSLREANQIKQNSPSCFV